MGVNWVYVGRYAQLQCAYKKGQAIASLVTLIVVFLSCIILQTILYLKTKKMFCHERSIDDSAMGIQTQKQNKHNLNSILKMIELKIVSEQQRTANDDSLDGIESIPTDSIVSNQKQREQHQTTAMSLNEIIEIK